MTTYTSKNPDSDTWSVWTKTGPTVADMEILTERTDFDRAIDMALGTGGSLVTVDLSYGA